MKKLVQKFGIIIIALFIPMSASAYDFEVDGLCYNILSEKERTVEITSTSERYLGNIEIPEKIIYASKIYTVTSIGDKAFYFNRVESVTIPNSVTSIGAWAFSNCGYLSAVSIGNSVISIGHDAFLLCGGLTSVNIPNSVTSIGDGAFAECRRLSSVTIPNSVTSIGNRIFSGCSRLASVSIPNTITSIGDEAFYHCLALTSVTIPNSVTSIGKNAFYYCTGLTTVTIPNLVTEIGVEAFRLCDNLEKIYMQCTTPILCEPYFTYSVFTSATLYVPIGTRDAYAEVYPWKKFINIEEIDYSGVEDVEVDRDLQISVEGGSLNVGGIDADDIITVYDLSGRVVYSGADHSVSGLSHGVYILKVRGKTAKFAL